MSRYSARMHRIPTACVVSLLALTAGAALAGCAATTSEDARVDADLATATALPAIIDTDWRCVELVDADGKAVPVTGEPPTLRISRDGRASGFAGVNRFGCDARIGNSTAATMLPVEFGPVMAKRMAGPPERMTLEGAFTEMLGAIRTAEVTRGEDGTHVLALRGEDRLRAKFVVAPSSDGANP